MCNEFVCESLRGTVYVAKMKVSCSALKYTYIEGELQV